MVSLEDPWLPESGFPQTAMTLPNWRWNQSNIYQNVHTIFAYAVSQLWWNSGRPKPRCRLSRRDEPLTFTNLLELIPFTNVFKNEYANDTNLALLAALNAECYGKDLGEPEARTLLLIWPGQSFARSQKLLLDTGSFGRKVRRSDGFDIHQSEGGESTDCHLLRMHRLQS